MKVTGRSALVRVVASTQQLTPHAGLVLVRELVGRLGVGELLDRVTVKKRSRGYSPAQAILGLCEMLIAGGECLDDVAVLRGDSAQELLRGHGLPEATTLGRFLRRFSLGHIGQLDRALEELFARVHPLLDREVVTLDLDATYIEHHGPAGSRQGTRGTYKGKVCWHPLLCFVGETGEWLHAKLRNGHAAASTGAIRFLDECRRRLPASPHPPNTAATAKNEVIGRIHEPRPLQTDPARADRIGHLAAHLFVSDMTAAYDHGMLGNHDDRPVSHHAI